MAKFRLKPVKITTVIAEQWFSNKSIKGIIATDSKSTSQFAPFLRAPEAPQFIELGDWVVSDLTTGEKKIVKDETFRASYEPIDIAAHNALKENWQK